MKIIRVPLKERSYSIEFGPLSRLGSRLVGLAESRSKILVVATQGLQEAGHLKRLMAVLKSHHRTATAVILPNGEKQKSLANLAGLYRAALRFGLDRKSTVLALGGGVITDLAGFFAATYMRGISLVSVPSSLLGMVDASIGGKTGIDLPEGKNLVGAFWQPRLVWIDTALLKSLPEREWKTGFAEIIKYGVIRDARFFTWLEGRVRENARVRAWLGSDVDRAISVSAQIKAQVVAADERETPLKGGREILNFGHTTGHALEAATRYRALSHGEAISIGMVMAGRLAGSVGLWSSGEQLRLSLLLDTVGLPVRFPKLSTAEKKSFWNALHKDKKHVSGLLRFVLPRKIGSVEVRSLPLAAVEKILGPQMEAVPLR